MSESQQTVLPYTPNIFQRFSDFLYNVSHPIDRITINAAHNTELGTDLDPGVRAALGRSIWLGVGAAAAGILIWRALK